MKIATETQKKRASFADQSEPLLSEPSSPLTAQNASLPQAKPGSNLSTFEPVRKKKLSQQERRSMRRQKSLEMANVAYAAWILEDALEGHHKEQYPKGPAGKELRKWTNALHHAHSRLFRSNMVLIMLLFIESPLWCQNSRAAWSFLSAEERCPLPDGSQAMMFGLPILAPLVGVVVEILCSVVIAEALWHERKLYRLANSHGFPRFRPRRACPEVFIGILFVMLLDCIVYVLVRQQSFRLASFGRIVLLFYWKRVREIFWAAANCLDEFANLLLLVTFTILTFAWLTIMVLQNLLDGEGPTTHTLEYLGGSHWGSFSAAVKSYYEMQTGANYPDNIIPLLTEQRWTAWLFIPFMVLSFFLFTQLMLAIVYAEYQNHVKENISEFYRNRTKGCAKAFEALATQNANGERVIRLDTFRALCDWLNEFPKMSKNMKDDCTQFLFAALDDDKSNELTLSEFFDACDLLQFSFWTAPKKSPLLLSWGMHSERLHHLVISGWIDKVVNTILVLNMVFIIVQSYLNVSNIACPPWVEYGISIFQGVYVLEVVLRLLDTSWLNYWSHPVNRFNCITSLVLLFANVGTLFAEYRRFLTSLLPFINIVRAMRLLALLREVRQLKLITTCIFNLVMISHDMCILLSVSILVFALVALQGWGGLLYPSNPVLHDSDYLSEHLGVFNFNDMTGSVLCLFNMLVLSYMPEYAQAMGRAIGHHFIGLIYCGSFFFLGVNIAFNIFMAFLIDIFVSLQEQEEKGEHGEEEENLNTMRRMLDEQGMVLHMNIPPSVTKARALRGVLDDLDDIVREAQECALKNLAALDDGFMQKEVEKPQEAIKEDEQHEHHGRHHHCHSEHSEHSSQSNVEKQKDDWEGLLLSAFPNNESQKEGCLLGGPSSSLARAVTVTDSSTSSSAAMATYKLLNSAATMATNADLLDPFQRLTIQLLEDKQKLLECKAGLESEVATYKARLESEVASKAENFEQRLNELSKLSQGEEANKSSEIRALRSELESVTVQAQADRKLFQQEIKDLRAALKVATGDAVGKTQKGAASSPFGTSNSHMSGAASSSLESPNTTAFLNCCTPKPSDLPSSTSPIRTIDGGNSHRIHTSLSAGESTEYHMIPNAFQAP